MLTFILIVLAIAVVSVLAVLVYRRHQTKVDSLIDSAERLAKRGK